MLDLMSEEWKNVNEQMIEEIFNKLDYIKIDENDKDKLIDIIAKYYDFQAKFISMPIKV